MRRAAAFGAALLAAPLLIGAQAQAPDAGACQGLASPGVAAVRITEVTAVARGSVHPIRGGKPAKRDYCRVQGVIEKEIGFELWLPVKGGWNGRFLAAGVGGQAGAIGVGELARGVDRGYASASTDTGHKAADTHWLLGDPERAKNYAERANHLLAVKSKAIVASYYGEAPRSAFFLGCSGGGRQAMTELQRYPDDYDGIIAGAPGVNTPEMSARRMWEMGQHSRFAGLMTEADWRWVGQAAVAACDANDGLKDGIVVDPMRCDFKPADVACGKTAGAKCLSPAQLALVERVFAPLKDETGKPVDGGLVPGIPVAPALLPEPFTPGPSYLAVALFGDGVHRDANWDAKTFRIADDLPAIDKVMNLHADDPKVGAFVRRGGKLILYQGLADPLVAPQPTIAYYTAVQKALGAKTTAGFARLFLAPGMEHCRGGGVPDAFGAAGGDAPVVDPGHDMLSALELWVDKGVAPERIVASQVEAGRVVRTRPLCTYPAQARYRGTGDVNDAASFACVIPGKSKS